MAKAMQNRLEETLIKALKTVEEIVLFSNTKFLLNKVFLLLIISWKLFMFVSIFLSLIIIVGL